MAEHTTPNFALPYPDFKGKVQPGPKDIQELAERADTVLSQGVQYLYEVGDVRATLATAPVSSWLLCDGSELSQTTYPTLYAAIKGKFGTAKAGNFLIPKLVGAFPFGASGGTLPFGGSGGAAAVMLTNNQSGLLPHQHIMEETVVGPHVFVEVGEDRYGRGSTASNTVPVSWVATTQPAAGDASQAHNNLPPYFAVRYYIRYA